MITQQRVVQTTTTSAENTAALSENTAALAENTAALAENTAALAENTAALAENTAALAENTANLKCSVFINVWFLLMSLCCGVMLLCFELLFASLINVIVLCTRVATSSLGKVNTVQYCCRQKHVCILYVQYICSMCYMQTEHSHLHAYFYTYVKSNRVNKQLPQNDIHAKKERGIG